MTPFLTLFTAPKPFTDPHIDVIQRNALQSWKRLGSDVTVVMIGDEAGMANVAAELGVLHIWDVLCNEFGTPLVSSIFNKARQCSPTPLLAYVNADILLMPDFLEAARQMAALAERFLIVGQRWDLDMHDAMDFSDGWDERLRARIRAEGYLHPPAGSDYFIFPRDCFIEIPDFAIGRSMWDNWMIFHALKQGWVTVDASPTIQIVHMRHDYGHLPNGRNRNRVPEALQNIRLAGGRRRSMYLIDVPWTIKDGQLRPSQWSWARFKRSIETFPVLKMDSNFLAEVSFAICHPINYIGEWQGRLMYKWRQIG